MREEGQRVEKDFLLELSPKMIKFKSLNRNKDFLRILKKKRLNTKYYTIYYDRNLPNFNNYLNISFVVKKKVGNAVKRNKIKRKLKYAIQKILKESKIIDTNYTYVIFGKNNVYKDKFNYLLDEVNETFKKIKRKLKYAVQKISRESKLIDPNYTYVIFGKNNVYKDKFADVLNEVNETFKKIKQIESRL